MICDGKRRKKNERGCCFFFCPSASASLYCRTIVRPSVVQQMLFVFQELCGSLSLELFLLSLPHYCKGGREGGSRIGGLA